MKIYFKENIYPRLLPVMVVLGLLMVGYAFILTPEEIRENRATLFVEN